MSGDFTPVSEAQADDAPAVELALEAAEDSAPRGLWGRLRAALTGTGDVAGRLAALDAAIAASPDAPANYLLRAELYARLGEHALALADFNRVETLAASGFERDNWGLVNQALRDRAAAGARDAARRLAAQPHQPQPEDDE